MSAALTLDTPKRGGKGGISQLRSHLQALAQADPEAIRTEVIALGREPFIAGIVDTLGETSRYCHSCQRHGKERWAFRLYAELAKLVGSAGDIALTVVNLVGAQPGVAKSAVETVERAKSLDSAGKARLWAQSLERYCREQGIEGLSIPSEILGSHAEVLENGTGLALNGTAGGSAHEKL